MFLIELTPLMVTAGTICLVIAVIIAIFRWKVVDRGARERRLPVLTSLN